MLKQDLKQNFQSDRPLPKEKIKKVFRLMKNKLGGQIIKEFVGLKANRYSYLKENNDGVKKPERHKKVS